MEHSIFHRRDLPHISRAERPIFVTFVTRSRLVLQPAARTLVMKHVLARHLEDYYVTVAVIMPDHAHVILSLVRHGDGSAAALASVMRGIKGTSARAVNQVLHREGPLWQPESFDHVARRFECTRRKIDYVCENPVRAGLVATADDYPWLWRSWAEGGERGVLPPWIRV